MSYEGSVEYLCEKGHRSATDCWTPVPTACRCGAAITHQHSIDHTNGAIEDDPSTLPAPTEMIGFDDIWNEDHYGNRYATKHVRYRPVEHWQKLHVD
jgi:hypothetical protein